MKPFLLVFLGAGVGGALRHAVNAAALRLLDSAFPYATLAVNIAGSLVMGLLAGWFAHKTDPGLEWRLFLTTGVLGGFTTFSAFSLDTVLLWERGQFWHAAFYVLVSVFLSILAFVGGLASIRAMD
jgi:CrcB protein